GPDVPHGWVAGDDEFGRATEFRAQLRLRQERYVLDVPASTLVREVARRPGGEGAAVERAEGWGARPTASRGETGTLRGGAKGPLEGAGAEAARADQGRRRARRPERDAHGPPRPGGRAADVVHGQQCPAAGAVGHPGQGPQRAPPRRGGAAG